jgi:hypothetical protein
VTQWLDQLWDTLAPVRSRPIPAYDASGNVLDAFRGDEEPTS